MEVKPEHVQMLVQGITPVQIIILVLLGIVALGIVVRIVKWVIDTRLGILPAEILEIRKSLDELKTDMAHMDAKLWDKDVLRQAIRAAIAEHIEHCPHHHGN